MYKCLLLFFVFLCVNCGSSNEYYWKDYTGKIPDDAVAGGHDINSETTYIGLVYLTDSGVFPATIHAGDKVVHTAADTVRRSENFIQILCAQNRENMRWIPANKTDFHFMTMNKHLIRGGIQDKNWLNIGRINYQGELIIGKVLSGRSGIHDALLRFVHNDVEKQAYSYEVLVFENVPDPKKDAEVVSSEVRNLVSSQ